jgi:hypothetical protein
MSSPRIQMMLGRFGERDSWAASGEPVQISRAETQRAIRGLIIIGVAVSLFRTSVWWVTAGGA